MGDRENRYKNIDGKAGRIEWGFKRGRAMQTIKEWGEEEEEEEDRGARRSGAGSDRTEGGEMAANWKRGRGVTKRDKLIYRCGFLEKSPENSGLQRRTALRGNKSWELMSTVCVEGDGEPDDRKSFIHTPKLQRHGSHIMRNGAFIQKGCIVNPPLFILLRATSVNASCVELSHWMQRHKSRRCRDNEVCHSRNLLYAGLTSWVRILCRWWLVHVTWSIRTSFWQHYVSNLPAESSDSFFFSYWFILVSLVNTDTWCNFGDRD